MPLRNHLKYNHKLTEDLISNKGVSQRRILDQQGTTKPNGIEHKFMETKLNEHQNEINHKDVNNCDSSHNEMEIVTLKIDKDDLKLDKLVSQSVVSIKVECDPTDFEILTDTETEPNNLEPNRKILQHDQIKTGISLDDDENDIKHANNKCIDNKEMDDRSNCTEFSYNVKVEQYSDCDDALPHTGPHDESSQASPNKQKGEQTQKPSKKKKPRKSRSKFNPPRTRRSLTLYGDKFTITEREGIKYFNCSICGYSTKRRSDIMIHLDTHAESKRFKCHICGYEAVRKFSLTLHMSTHTGEKPFACDKCDYTCSRKSYLLLHLRTHENIDQWFTCNFCDFRTTRKCGLSDHIKLHTREKKFVCEVCDFKTVTRGNLKKHLVRHSLTKLQCSECDYSTCRSQDLALHKLKHSTDKPFACTVCGFRTNRIITHRLHLTSHFTDKVFNCSQCDYKSNRRGNLRSHMKIHATLKPHKCDLCDFTSAKRQCMQRHVKTHDKGTIFSCPICNFRCSSKSYLNRHQKEHDSGVCASDFVATELKDDCVA